MLQSRTPRAFCPFSFYEAILSSHRTSRPEGFRIKMDNVGLGLSIPLIVKALTMSETRRVIGATISGATRWFHGKHQDTNDKQSSRKSSWRKGPDVTQPGRQSIMRRPDARHRIWSPFGIGRHVGEDLE